MPVSQVVLGQHVLSEDEMRSDRFEMRIDEEFVRAIATIQQASKEAPVPRASDIVRKAVIEKAKRVSQKGGA